MNLKVQDFPLWKRSFDEELLSRHDAGEADCHVYRDLADPSDVTILLEWETADRARHFLNSEESSRIIRKGAAGPVQMRYMAEAMSLRRTSAD